jgi:hypothetical protein
VAGRANQLPRLAPVFVYMIVAPRRRMSHSRSNLPANAALTAGEETPALRPASAA